MLILSIRVEAYNTNENAETTANKFQEFNRRLNGAGLCGLVQFGSREIWFAHAGDSENSAHNYADYFRNFEEKFPERAAQTKRQIDSVEYPFSPENLSDPQKRAEAQSRVDKILNDNNPPDTGGGGSDAPPNPSGIEPQAAGQTPEAASVNTADETNSAQRADNSTSTKQSVIDAERAKRGKLLSFGSAAVCLSDCRLLGKR
jgi:hypothetical protein